MRAQGIVSRVFLRTCKLDTFEEINVYIYVSYVIYLKTRLNPIKIRKSLNRCNSEDNETRWMNRRSLEARNLAL